MSSGRAIARFGLSGGPPGAHVAPGGDRPTPCLERVPMPPRLPSTYLEPPSPVSGHGPYVHIPEGPLPWFPEERWDAWRPSGGGRHGFTRWRMP